MLKKTLIALALIALLGALVALGFRPLAAWYLAAPEKFSALAESTAWDYQTLDAWYAHPKKTTGAILAPGASLGERSPTGQPADVFYLHPTSYFGPGEWNSPANDQEFARQGIEHFMSTQASSFSDCCEIYMPRYRQAHLGSFAQENYVAGSKALEFAYRDTLRAFKEFLRQRDPKRPFFIAGHSQGSLHGLRLLVTEVEGTALHDSLVAAYLIGYWLPADIQGSTLKDTPLCSGASDTGCLVTFDTFETTGRRNTQSDSKLPIWYRDGWRSQFVTQTLCLNPILWTVSGDSADKSQNLGSVPWHAKFSMAGLLRNTNPGFTYAQLSAPTLGVTGAACAEDGALEVDPQDGTPFNNPGKGEEGSLHPLEWNMFHQNIRSNINDRLLAFRAEE